MVSIPDGSFRSWQDADVIKATEYTQEREMLRTAINENNSRLSVLESSTAAVSLGNVQAQKITSDTGDVMLSVPAVTGDILAELVKAGRGMRSFYAAGGSKNLPPSKISIRGLAHFTSADAGWVYATDYKNTVFVNYYVTGTWTGWDELVSTSKTQEELWSGPPAYMFDGQTVTPTKKLTDCRNGWILVWSDFNPSNNTAGNSDFHYSYVPKFIATKHNGANHLFSVPYTPDNIVVKYLTVLNDKLQGMAGNELAPDNDVVLRYVLEW